MPVIRNDRGDTISYTYPPDPSSYVRNQLIIKFKEGALNYSDLCWGNELASEKGNDGALMGMDPTFRSFLMKQRFHVDSGIVASVPAREMIKALGGTYLRRITNANPCKDRYSIARDGARLSSDDYNWMLLDINNDTSVVALAVYLTIFYRDAIELAEPNYVLYGHKEPIDSEYVARRQTSVEMIGMPIVWDRETGLDSVRVGVIDDGIDYNHCDLGPVKGDAFKVVRGWSYTEDTSEFRVNSDHGTAVSAIIGAYTNRDGCPTAESGMAGMAGGWVTQSQDDGIGVKLYGYRIEDALPYVDPVTGDTSWPYSVARAIGAIRDAVAWNDSTGRGDSVHVLNNSWGAPPGTYSESLRSAVAYAYEHRVSFVASRGNGPNTDSPVIPATLDEPWVVSVGGSSSWRSRTFFSEYGTYMDVLAPSGFLSDNLNVVGDTIVRTAMYDGGYRWFDGTSAAAPHVAGTIALLRSHTWRRGWRHWQPEDYEGVIKASAEDISKNLEFFNPPTPYTLGYDLQSGWGFLRADSVFARLMPTPDTSMQSGAYRVVHFNISSSLDTSGIWKSLSDNIHFVGGGRSPKPETGGSYRVKYREVTVSQYISSGAWASGYPRYVWGRGDSIGGFSLANPNYQIPWTEVTNGGGGGNTFGMQRGIRLTGDTGLSRSQLKFTNWRCAIKIALFDE